MKAVQKLFMLSSLFRISEHDSYDCDSYDYDFCYDDSFENSRRKKGKMLLKNYRENIKTLNNLNKNHLRNGRKK